MIIKLTSEEYEELKILVGIFEDFYIDHKPVDSFEVIKDMVDSETDIDKVEPELKEHILFQLKEGFDWLAELNVKVDLANKLLYFFDRK